MLADKLVNLIDANASEMNPRADYCLNKVATSIHQLKGHISGKIMLSDARIEALLDRLVGVYTVTLDQPILPGLKILRAAKYDKVDESAGHDKVSRLSYYKTSDPMLPPMGRLNKQGAALFYGCIYFNDDWGGVNVAFAKVNARAGEKINILDSVTTDEINLRYIGIYDHVKRNAKPGFLSDGSFNYYTEAYEYQRKCYQPDLFVAFQLCDAFFADMMRRKETPNLYQITSRLGEMFLAGDKADGVIYTSVQAEDGPVVAIKPASVDRKLKHTAARSFMIQRDYGYAMYNAKQIFCGKLSGDSIIWGKLR